MEKIWLKRVLIPFWVIEMCWFIIMLVIAAIDIHIRTYDRVAVDIAAAVLITICGISILLDIAAMVLLHRQKLTPVTFLVFQCVKSFFWTGIFLLDIIAAAGGDENAGSFIWSTVVFLTSIGQLSYGSVIVHRQRKRRLGAYRGVNAPDGANSHLNPGYESPPRGSYAGYNPRGTAPNPFRDPSPGPSIRTQEPTATHPALRPGSSQGEASSYYDGGKYDPAPQDITQAAEHSYEMQNTAYRAA